VTEAALAPTFDVEAHPVLFFDGVCNLCHGTVRFVLERDRAARIRFAPLQSEVGRALLVRHGLDADTLDTVVFLDAAGVHLRSDASVAILRALGPPWSALAVLGVLPRSVRDAGYDWIARNRYRWFGQKDTCPAPRPAWRERFLA
jgi:predicted DCC family thiol-disulfide oxidoreductase YuxK